MKALIKNELRLTRKMLLIWMGIVLVLSGFAYCEYLSLKDNLNELSNLVLSFPKVLQVMFGIGGDLATTLGWYGCIYFWVTILTHSYAVYLGVSCVMKEKVKGTVDYLFTKPVSRSTIVCAKATACMCNIFVLSVFSGLCNYFTAILPLGGLAEKGAAVTTTIGLFLTDMTLFSITFFLSGLMSSYKGAVRLGTGALLAFYGISAIVEYMEIPALYYLTPLKYFDIYTVAQSGIYTSFFLLSIIIVIASVAATQKIWTGKEL